MEAPAAHSVPLSEAFEYRADPLLVPPNCCLAPPVRTSLVPAVAAAAAAVCDVGGAATAPTVCWSGMLNTANMCSVGDPHGLAGPAAASGTESASPRNKRSRCCIRERSSPSSPFGPRRRRSPGSSRLTTVCPELECSPPLPPPPPPPASWFRIRLPSADKREKREERRERREARREKERGDNDHRGQQQQQQLRANSRGKR